MATLYVNPGHVNASDSTAKASNTATNPWSTIGRAAWGNASRSSPDAGEAAAAGDTVLITAGTYAYSGSALNHRYTVVYNPTNEGTAGNYITFQAVGQVRLTAPGANSPVIGADGKDYIKWIADITAGANAFLITCDGRGGSTHDTKSDPNVVNTAPDTGPVVGHDCVGLWIEGCTIDGGPQVDYTDNWDGIHLDSVNGYTLRNNTVRSFRNQSDTANGAAVKLYQSPNGLVEHNDLSDCGSGVAFKDTPGATLHADDTVVRYNWIEGVNTGVSMSLSDEGANDVYQNVIKDVNIALEATGQNVVGLRFFNNTCIGLQDGLFWHASESLPSSAVQVWNNIFESSQVAIHLDAMTMPAEGVIDLEHNCYQLTAGVFYTGSDGNRDLNSFNGAYGTQHDDSPAAIVDDPEFINAAQEDYRLGLASPARSLGVHPDTLATVHAGAYQASEVIGLEVAASAVGGAAALVLAVL